MNELQEVFKRARWAQTSPRTWALKCANKDGSAVLARIEQNGMGYVFEIDGVRWAARSYYAARCAACATLREVAQ
jgi:hypothetical protein